MILHMPSSGGKPILISLPRDSWVNIPGYGNNKINAAYAFGGPTLLAKTVQNATGLRIDHYMEIGFGGFVKRRERRRRRPHVHQAPAARPGLGPAPAQGLPRPERRPGARPTSATGTTSPSRTCSASQDQRLFLKALLSKLTSTGVLLNPFAIIPAASGAAGTLTVDKGTSLYQLAEAAFALQHPQTTTVPIANSNFVTSTARTRWSGTGPGAGAVPAT